MRKLKSEKETVIMMGRRREEKKRNEGGRMEWKEKRRREMVMEGKCNQAWISPFAMVMAGQAGALINHGINPVTLMYS